MASSLLVIETVAEHAVLDAFDAVTLAVVSRSCRGAARRAVSRRFGAVTVAPYLCDLGEASRRTLDGRGLRALARLLSGGGGVECVLDRLLGASDAALAAFCASPNVAARCERLAVRACPRLRSPGALVGALPRLRTLSLERCGQLADAELRGALAAAPPTLEGLSVAGCSVTTTDAFLVCAAAAPCAPSLAFLDVSGMKKLTVRGLAALGRAAGALRSLRLDGCDGVDVAALLRDAALFPALAEIHAKRGSPGAARRSDLFAGLAARPRLEVASLAAQCFFAATRRGPRDAAPVAAVAAPRLARLELQGCSVDAVAVAFFRGGPRRGLLALDLSACSGAAREDLEAVAAKCPDLRSLRLACLAPTLTSDALCGLVAELPRPERLKLLDVTWNDGVTAGGVRRAAERLSPDATIRANGKARARKRPRAAGRCPAQRADGEVFEKRVAFSCGTCSPGQGDVFCEHCAATCHAGHDVVYKGKMKMFCDCPTLCAGHRVR